MVSITDNISEALKYPIKNYKKTLMVGVLLTIIGLCNTFILDQCYGILKIIESTDTHILINGLPKTADINIQIIAVLLVIGLIFLILVMGFLYNILRSAFNKNEGNVFVNGVKYFAVSLAYNIIPAILFYLGFIVWINSSIGQYIMILSAIAFIIFNLLLVTAIPHMVYTDDIKEAFNIRKIINLIGNLGWLKYIGMLLFTAIVFCIIVLSLTLIISMIIALIFTVFESLIVFLIMAVICNLTLDSYLTIFLNEVCGLIYLECIEK